uniref:Uncharacterized protein n=1 Tax=Arundo donax TaxID=35708 RepID=A0A0A9EJC6_ARUDO
MGSSSSSIVSHYLMPRPDLDLRRLRSNPAAAKWRWAGFDYYVTVHNRSGRSGYGLYFGRRRSAAATLAR